MWNVRKKIKKKKKEERVCDIASCKLGDDERASSEVMSHGICAWRTTHYIPFPEKA
jgi:hypothetical protein